MKLGKPSTVEKPIERVSNHWGIDLNYEDAFGKWHDASDETMDAILYAMGVDPAADPHENEPVMVVRQGDTRRVPGSWEIALENGEKLSGARTLPSDLPLGYHTLSDANAKLPQHLIVSPGKCFLPEALRTWGWAVQLYSARSRKSWGIGDFRDLDTLACWSREMQDAGMLLINPLSAASPITPQQASPYYPASRRFFNPLWIHVEWVAEQASSTIPQLDEIAKAARDLNVHRLIDRDRVFELKMRALELLWEHFTDDAAFDRFCEQQGADLHRFAVFCALAENFKSGWHAWPERYRHPDSSAVRLFAQEHNNRVRFHKWLQWLLDTQLERCSKHLALMQDLPIGVDPDGADCWAWQDVFAKGIGVGAPPDEFNTQGQNWGLPPFIPHKLRAAGYQPFIQTIRAAFRHGGGLRIDHVMGLFRLYWVPAGMSAARGTYVRYNADEMLSIVALESHRARAYVVGEDLGTVEKEAREKLAKYGILSYRLLWFEKEDPSTYPHEALAAVTTHDLPTVAGLWTGSDLHKQRALNLNPNEESTTEICTRLTKCAGLKADSPLDEVVCRAYEHLAKAPSRILTAALDDAEAVEERPNMPATVSDQNPNWCMALPRPIEDLMKSPIPQQIAAVLSRR